MLQLDLPSKMLSVAYVSESQKLTTTSLIHQRPPQLIRALKPRTIINNSLGIMLHYTFKLSTISFRGPYKKTHLVAQAVKRIAHRQLTATAGQKQEYRRTTKRAKSIAMASEEHTITIAPSSSPSTSTATKSDTPISAARLSEIYFAAFTDDAVSQAIFPRTPISRQWWTAMLADELTDPTSRFVALQDAQGKTLAFAKWCLPKPKSGPDGAAADDEMPAWPADSASDHELADEFFGGLVAHRGAFGASLPPAEQARGFYYLELIAVDPSAQGKGLGQRLFRWGIDEADRAGLPCYLEAGPKTVTFYAREGFEPVSRVTVQVPGVGEYFNQCMVRWPQQHNEAAATSK